MKEALFRWLRRHSGQKANTFVPEYVSPIRLISNAELVEKDVPGAEANWDQWSGIPSFAASFNGDQFWGSFEKCFEVSHLADSRSLRDLTLTERRTVLFCQYRAIAHDDGHLTADDLPRARAVIAEIRDRVRRRAID